ncbi:hypothetical protein SASPL_145610 [Salvia splendens]|uniref:Hyaluronan/mRNA-binding protein domain-containing protein n=1 Tax=Salvia splendens TaxID=180675 RepID=A0A8X8WJ75_SALSN|nr:hypothetical protein SASPL_145610 [Salvia splendens]
MLNQETHRNCAIIRVTHPSTDHLLNRLLVGTHRDCARNKDTEHMIRNSLLSITSTRSNLNSSVVGEERCDEWERVHSTDSIFKTEAKEALVHDVATSDTEDVTIPAIDLPSDSHNGGEIRAGSPDIGDEEELLDADKEKEVLVNMWSAPVIGEECGNTERFYIFNHDIDRGSYKYSPENDNSYGNGEISAGQVAYDGADAGKCYGKRAGFTNGDGGKRDHPCRSLVCHSGTDYGNELKREDADRGNWGTQTDELVQASSALDFIVIMSKPPPLEIRRLYMGPIPARVEQFWGHG